jgi:hypothetical protein
MLLKLLSHFLSSLLVLSLCGLIVASVMSQTVMSSHYLEGQLDKANAYNRLSAALSDEVTKQAGVAGNPQISAAAKSVLNSAALKQKISTALDQLALYYQGKGPAPTINLNDFTSQLQTAGVALPANNDLSQPIKLAPDAGTNKSVAYPAKSFAQTRTATIITSILLALALLAVSWQRHRYGALPNALITVGVFFGLGALALDLVPGLFDHAVKFDTASNAFASLGHDLAVNIVRDLARRFGIIAAVLLVVGIAGRIVATRLQSNSKALTPLKASPKGAIS